MAKNTRTNDASRSIWPWLIGVGALVVILLGAFMLLPNDTGNQPAAPVEAGGPRLQVDQERIDFGQIPVNQVVKAQFTLTNAGSEPLQILGEPVVRVVEGC